MNRDPDHDAGLENPTACPRCDRKPLVLGRDAYRCAACNVDFPIVDAIPWLFAEPAAALGEWRARLHRSLRELESQRRSHEDGARVEGVNDTTRRRLESMRSALEDQSQRLAALLEPLGVGALTATRETHLALRTRLPSDQGLLTYYGNVHRDWAWGEDENEASLEIVAAALSGHEPRSVLVLGAGAGRLAYDIHMRLAPSRTVALDFNPLLLGIARRVTSGEPVELYEFPIAPRNVEQQAILRRLAAPRPVRPGLDFVLADAHRPPFRPGAFDTVVTPWLVDILPEPFDALAARASHLLGEGGRWINFGSLSFHDADPARRLTPEECGEAIAAAGFAPPELGETSMPYLCSPASRHGRRELVVTWCARKERDVSQPPRHRALPDWLVLGTEPVPLTAAFREQITATRIHAFVMSLIDGRRSLKDMARVLAEHKLMTAEEAEPALRGFLTKMLDDSRRGSPF